MEKVICCCDEPVPVLAFGELGRADRRDGGVSAHCWLDLAVPELKAKLNALVCT